MGFHKKNLKWTDETFYLRFILYHTKKRTVISFVEIEYKNKFRRKGSCGEKGLSDELSPLWEHNL